LKTILLDRSTWDLVLDAQRNLAVATEPYRLAQDAASACRAFLGEVWYDTKKGIPYWGQILGHRPPLSLIKAKMVAVAMTVPGVVAAQCFISSVADRTVRGQIQVTDANGVITAAAF
jgi:hypothetical protein